MSHWGKGALLISGFCLIIMLGARVVLGAWHPLLYGFALFSAGGLIISVFLDHKLYLEFLSIKTAKKGLSLGWSLLVLIVFCAAAAYLSSRFNPSLDLTEEGLNSLSDQTMSALKNLDADLTFRVFYKGDKISKQALAIKQDLKENFALYRQNSSKAKMVFIDAYKNSLKAEKYLSDLPDKDRQELFVFADYKGRSVRASAPFNEESLTSAIIKARKREFKKILFLVGRGEKSLNSSDPDGLKILEKALSDSGFSLNEWNFTQQGPPQGSVSLIADIGPRQPLLPAEKAWLESYLKNGGSLFLSLDPKERHSFQDFLKGYGLVFKDDFILSRLGLLYGGPTKALGVLFDKSHPITKGFSANQAVFFEKASSIDIQEEGFKNFEFSALIRSHQQSWTAPQLKEKIKIGKLKAQNMAVELSFKTESSSGKSEEQKTKKSSKKKPFRLALFGDSDFLSNRYIYDGANKDLALNAFVSLAGEEKLAGIRPRLPKGTKITLSRPQRALLVLLYVGWPCLFLLFGLWLWHRRREA